MIAIIQNYADAVERAQKRIAADEATIIRAFNHASRVIDSANVNDFTDEEQDELFRLFTIINNAKMAVTARQRKDDADGA